MAEAAAEVYVVANEEDMAVPAMAGETAAWGSKAKAEELVSMAEALTAKLAM